MNKNIAFSYDGLGRESFRNTRRMPSSDAMVTSYYDASDQPTSISGAASGNYLYDGNMKRVRSIVNGKTIYNVYDASGTLTHVDAVTDNKKTDYISKTARISNGVITYLHPDHLGSAVSGTTSTGAMAWAERYTPFGETMLSPTANDNLGGYTGHIRDAATGLNYMQARYYDPALGRFLSIDPVGFMETGNPRFFTRYAYGFNDPINLIDPSGQAPCDVVDCDRIKEAATDVLESIGRGVQAAQRDPEGFQDGVAKGIANGVSDTINGAVTIGEIASPNLTVGQVPDAPRFEQGSSEAENFGMAVGETGFHVATAAAVGPKVATTTANVVGKVSTSGLAGSVARGLGSAFGPKGAIFGDTAFGATRQGILNQGKIRVGFGRHKGAQFRIGVGNRKYDIGQSIKKP